MSPAVDSFEVVCNAIRYMADGLTNTDVEHILQSFHKQGWKLVRKPTDKQWIADNCYGTCWSYGEPDGMWELMVYNEPKGRWTALRNKSTAEKFHQESAEFSTIDEAARWCMT